MLDDATRSVSGDLRAFNIFDVTQSLMSGRKTARVTVQSSNRKGYVYFRDGQIVAAVDDSLSKGQSAVMDIFSWSGGSFTIDFDVPSETVNIDVPTDHLLLEVARGMDELRRDRDLSPEDDVDGDATKGELKQRVGEELRDRLNRVFKRVADEAEPARARYTFNAFDGLLQALNDLQGTVLFLRPGQRPRIKSRGGLSSLNGELVTTEEIQGFLQPLLSETEQRQLRETKEVETFFHSETVGSFKVNVLNEHGRELLTFAPTGKLVSRLEALCPDPEQAAGLAATNSGLIVVGGPLGSGKAPLVSAVIAHHMESRGAFAIQFSDRNRHTYDQEPGFCIHRSLPAPGDLRSALRSALEQGPEVVGIVGANDPDAFALALSAAGEGRLVLFTLDSHTPRDTVRRMMLLATPQGGDSLAPLLAERLRHVVDCQAATVLSSIAVDDEERTLLRRADVAGLASRRTTPAPCL